MSWLHDTSAEILSRVAELKQARAWPFFRPQENVGPRVKVGARSYINFTSNDYLGLSRDPDYRFAGLWSFFVYAATRKKRGGERDD